MEPAGRRVKAFPATEIASIRIIEKLAATSEACELRFTWQEEQDRDTLLSSSVRISCFRMFS